MARVSSDRNSSLLDRAALERLALSYVGRYATTRARLAAYLTRKARERGWAGEGAPSVAVEAIVARCAALGYVDDRAFAEARATALRRRGYGARRVAEALRAAGIEEADAAPIRETMRDGAWEAALAFARRRRLGPFGEPAAEADPVRRRRAFAAMLRAGHAPSTIQRILDTPPGESTDSGT